MEARVSFTTETTQRFYGLGNASQAPAVDVPARDFYGRTHPMVWVRARYRVVNQLHAGFGAYYTQNWLTVSPDSTLAQQMMTGDETVRRILGQASSHGVLILEALLLYDGRDSEIAPDTGQYHQIKLRMSPALADALPYQYFQINATSRFYLTVIPERLVLAARVVADVQLGDPPFYELARYDDTYALGGGNGVRGVPAQRYYGKVKVLANVELRTEIVTFHAFGKPVTFGLTGFADGGRVWADTTPQPALDGEGLGPLAGLKYGVGGGVRLQSGSAFVLRADVAWSPDATPIAAYVAAGQTF
jgi:outer membrane protein assembly factor BamA